MRRLIMSSATPDSTAVLKMIQENVSVLRPAMPHIQPYSTDIFNCLVYYSIYYLVWPQCFVSDESKKKQKTKETKQAGICVSIKCPNRICGRTFDGDNFPSEYYS